MQKDFLPHPQFGSVFMPAETSDFRSGAELLIINGRRTIDPKMPLVSQGHFILVDRVDGDDIVRYRYRSDADEICAVPLKNFFAGESFVLKRRTSAEVISIARAA